MQFGGFLAAVKTLGWLTRVAHSVHFLMILLLLSGGVSAATPAEDSLPRLSLNNDAAVCPVFFEVVKKSFQSPEYIVSARERPWPINDFEWVFSPQQHEANALRVGSEDHEVSISRRAVDLAGDGKTELLVLRSSAFGWQGDIHSLVRYPTAQNFDVLATAGRAHLLGDGTNLLPHAQGGDDDEPKWNWNPPSVARVGGKYFLLWEGEPYEDVFPPTLYRIRASGLPEIACKVDLVADVQARLGPLEGGPIAALYEQLVDMAGTRDYKCGGQIDDLGRRALSASFTRWRLTARPWALRDGYNPRPRVDSWLEAWAYQGLRNYRIWRSFKATEPKALSVLNDHYRRAFGFQDSDAQARLALDRAITGHFAFPTQPQPGSHPEVSDLAWALLEGRPNADILRFIERARSVLLSDAFDKELEKSVLLALEHPDALRLLLDAGAPANAKESYGKTALMYAAQFDLVDTARLLLERGATIGDATRAVTADENSYCESPYFTERTALHYAAASGSLTMIRLLVERGANPGAMLSDQRTPGDFVPANTRLSDAERDFAQVLLRR